MKNKENRLTVGVKNLRGRIEGFHLAVIGCMAAVMCRIGTADAFAAGDLASVITDGLNGIYGTIIKIIAVVYGFTLVIGALRIYISSGREVDGIWSYIKRCTAAFLIIMCAGLIVAFVKGLTGDTPTTLG